MPRPLDPTQTIRLSLESDQDLPEEKRPTFICRYLNGREWRQAVVDIDQAADGQRIGMVFKFLENVLVGWEHITDRDGSPIPFVSSDVDIVLDNTEANELLTAVASASRLSYADKKKSESQPSGAPSDSVAAAG